MIGMPGPDLRRRVERVETVAKLSSDRHDGLGAVNIAPPVALPPMTSLTAAGTWYSPGHSHPSIRLVRLYT